MKLANDGDSLRATTSQLSVQGDGRTAESLLDAHLQRLETQPSSTVVSMETIDSLRMKADLARQRGDSEKNSELIRQAWDKVQEEFHRTGKYPVNAVTIANYIMFDSSLPGGYERKKQLAFEFLSIPGIKQDRLLLTTFLNNAVVYARSAQEWGTILDVIDSSQVSQLAPQLMPKDLVELRSIQAQAQLRTGNTQAALQSLDALIDSPAPPIKSAISQVRRIDLIEQRIDALRHANMNHRAIDERVELLLTLDAMYKRQEFTHEYSGNDQFTQQQLQNAIVSSESSLTGAESLGRPEVSLWIYERMLAANNFTNEEQRQYALNKRDQLVQLVAALPPPSRTPPAPPSQPLPR